ncbi:TIR domain-containing protein [Paeniglutamicibacter psychrophenolicus]|uniref:TIR domain-containing protein n=1 Tax=Paeniglutamicibacter psychrophenolicus TaxID=257454 RepID=A0ABS4WG55_9MICC|nr:TIR domain-containing protein [Paeniglutamicibacter psychrophenolicus]MBP2375177.1 hypothetical protein [Paeniglutamicibacter psychrophenolicus]
MSESIFISYRRATSTGSAGRVYDALAAHFGEEHVFMDVDSIEPGEEFAGVLTETLSGCRAVLVVIDPDWLEVADAQGRRRLDDPGDFVRLEVESALVAGVKVFPVLVGGAAMPSAAALPAPLRSLAGKQAVEISPTRFRYDAGRLIIALEGIVGVPKKRPKPSWREEHAGRFVLPRWALPSIGGVLAVVLIVVVVLLQRPGPASWQPLPDAPLALEGASMAAHGEKIWVAGGVSARDGRELLDDVNIYDPATRSWSAGPQLPEPLAFGALVAAGPDLYLVGGQGAAGAVDTTLRLDAGTGEWLRDEPLPASREAGAAAWDGSRIVYAGGVGTDHAAAREVYALAAGAWKQIGELSVAREKPAALSDGFGTVWIIGGRDRASGVPAFGTVDVVQVDGISRGQSVRPVHSAAAVWIPGAGPCAIAGDTGLGVSAQVQCLNGPAGIPALPVPRAGLAAAALGPEIYVMGGYDDGQHGSAVLNVFRAGGQGDGTGP